MQRSREKDPLESQGPTRGSTDQESFLSLIESHQRLLLKVCWTFTYSSHDRDDLFQEIVGRLWAAFGTFDHDRRFSTWMYRVALNVAIDFRRRHQRRQGVKSLEETQEPVSPEDAYKNELSVKLHELLGKQNDADLAILLLYLEGNSYRNIAEVMEINESNVGTRISRLKNSLRQSANS